MIKTEAYFRRYSKKARAFFACFLAVALAVVGFVALTPSVSAATVSVDTFAELKEACQTSGTVKITSGITLTDTITVPKDVTIYLTCSHDAGSTTADVTRAKGFHGHMFKVNDGATVYIRCCINGNLKDSSGNIRGFASDNTEASGYYGQAMILNYGSVIMDNDKSVLKNNYNAYNNDYKAGTLWTYDGTKYYGLSASPESTSLAGSAVLCVNGKFTMSNGQIYGCYADNGPAIYVCNGYAGDQVKISGGTIKNNVARRYGGAIFAASRKPYDDYSSSSSYVGSRTLNSTGSNALLTVSGGKICNNLARLNSGAVWTGFGATFYMSGGSIYNNDAVEEGGGGIRVNAGGEGTTGGWMCFADPGGQAWIAGGSIYSNTCATNGGGITVPDNDDANNQLKISGGNIYQNTAKGNGGGVYCASKVVMSSGNIYKNTATGNGGGIYLTGTGTISMSAGTVYSNTATQGGGIYLTESGGACTISGGSIYSNTANYGGGICTFRLKGLTLSNVNVYNNTANTSGGGVRSGNSNGGSLTINSGFYYGNTNIGVYVVGGNATINGGKFGVSAYTNYSEYTVSRNTSSQLTIAADAEVTINSTSYPRIISTLLDGEAIGANKGIVNNGSLTVTNTSSNAFDIYGTGTAVYNTGTFNINGNFNILSSGKDGTDTVQQRLGIQNTATGTVVMNSSEAEIKYCGYRGVLNNGSFTLKAGKIYNCTSPDITANYGGGVVNSGDDSVFTMSGGEIYNNSANYGGGVYFTTSGKASTISGGSIYSNTATTSGGGLGTYRTNAVTLSGGSIYSNTAKYGGGVYTGGLLNLKGATIYSNTANDSNGGGIYVTGDNSALSMTSGVIRNNSAKSHGGGIYFTTAGKASTISGGSIYENEAGGSGGAFLTYRTNGVTISGGSLYSNKATLYGGGVYIGSCPLTMTGGSIYSNSADSGKGNGVFLAADSTFKMSNTAAVNTNNDVFLKDGTFVSVPTVFTGTQNVRALLTGENMTTGRVVAKYGSATTDKGSNALYWSPSAPDMSEQYFTVSGKLLRSGDQGAASETDSVTNQDVFISEAYTISFVGNLSGYTVTVPNSINKYWNETLTNVTFANASASSAPYTFTGWNTKADGSGTTYKSPLTYSENKDLTLYAQWKINTYTVSYNANGGSGAPGSQTKTHGVALTLSSTKPTREGYTFTGWNTKADGSGTAYASGGSYTGNASVTLYAQWKINTYTVSYNANGGTGAPGSQTKTYGVALTLSSTKPTREGYTFTGWNTKADGTGTAYASGASYTANASVTLYAQWKENTLTINYYSNFADSSSTAVLNPVSGDKNVLVKTSVLYPTSNLSDGLYNYSAENSTLALGRTGYSGTGYWNTKTDGSGYGVHEDASFNHYQDLAKAFGVDVSNGNATVNVYAQWIQNRIDIDYDGNGATKGEGWTETIVLNDNPGYVLSNKTNAFERVESNESTGSTRLFKFVGWILGDSLYDFGETVSPDVLNNFAQIINGRENRVTTVYAGWDEFPTIKAVDRWFTLDDVKAGKVTLDELFRTAKAIDGEVGDKTIFEAGEGTFTIIDFDAEEFKKFTTTGSVTVTYQAIDKAGNETYRTITVHIVDKDKEVEDVITVFTRFISERYFKDKDGNFIPESDGGLNVDSIWVRDVGYLEYLTTVLENTQDNTGTWNKGVYVTFVFSKEDVATAKAYVADHGLGNVQEPDALINFYNTFKG